MERETQTVEKRSSHTTCSVLHWYHLHMHTPASIIIFLNTGLHNSTSYYHAHMYITCLTTVQYPLFHCSFLYMRIRTCLCLCYCIIQYMIGSSEHLVAYCHIGDPDVPWSLVRSAPAAARPVTTRCLMSLPSSRQRSTLHCLSPPR